jgi:hypothetical protein
VVDDAVMSVFKPLVSVPVRFVFPIGRTIDRLYEKRRLLPRKVRNFGVAVAFKPTQRNKARFPAVETRLQRFSIIGWCELVEY